MCLFSIFSVPSKSAIVLATFNILLNILLILGTLLTILIGEHYIQNRKYFKGEFFSILLFALTLSPSFSYAIFNKSLLSISNLQYFSH